MAPVGAVHGEGEGPRGLSGNEVIVASHNQHMAPVLEIRAEGQTLQLFQEVRARQPNGRIEQVDEAVL